MNEVEKILESLDNLNGNELFKIRKRLDECILKARYKKEEKALTELKKLISKWADEDVYFVVAEYDDTFELNVDNVEVV